MEKLTRIHLSNNILPPSPWYCADYNDFGIYEDKLKYKGATNYHHKVLAGYSQFSTQIATVIIAINACKIFSI